MGERRSSERILGGYGVLNRLPVLRSIADLVRQRSAISQKRSGPISSAPSLTARARIVAVRS